MNEILQKRIEEAVKNICCTDCPFENIRACKTCVELQNTVNVATFALQNQWISVEEALPECNKCHFAMYEDGGIIVAKYENETWWWQDGFVVGRNTDGDLMYSSSCEVPSSLITHWMMIPTINNEEK